MAPPLTPPPPPEDPETRAWKARWAAFEQADCEGKIALFTQTLDEPELMDGEMTFEMLNRLNEEMAARGERRRLEDLVDALRRKLPDLYRQKAKYLLSWRVENALAD